MQPTPYLEIAGIAVQVVANDVAAQPHVPVAAAAARAHLAVVAETLWAVQQRARPVRTPYLMQPALGWTV